MRFIVAVIVASALIPLNSTMIAVALPDMGETLKAEPGDMTLWLVTSYLLVNIILQSPAGKLGDMIGRRRAFDIGLGLFAIGVAIAVLAPYLATMALSRVVMAAGGAMLMPNAMALLRTSIPEEHRSFAFGIFGAVLSASAAIGPLIGGLLTSNFGWKAIFLVNLPLLLLSFLLVRGKTAQPNLTAKPKAPRKFDFVGMFFLAFSLIVLVIGLKLGGYWVLPAILLGAVGFYSLAKWEARVDDPLIEPELLKIKPLIVGGTIVGLQNLGMYALLFQMPFLMKSYYQLDISTIGQILLTLTLFMVICAPFGGWMAGRIGSRNIIAVGLVVSMVGFALLVLTAGNLDLFWMPLALSLVGAGIGMANGPLQSIALSAVEPDQSGVASGMISTLRYLGGIIGITIISLLLVSSEPEVQLQQNVVCFGLYFVANLIALVMTFLLPRK
ncbi:MAG: EmrB/QacA subfamily drug resistance transporter [Gammaproteobacteria bacterium]|jgi:EmrB/QacA subfamily drug resistance transporter